MPRIQIIDKKDWNAYNNLLNYIANQNHSIGRYIGGTNLLVIDDPYLEDRIKQQIEQLMAIHRVYNQRLAFHVILTFSDIERAYLTPEKLIHLSYNFCKSVFDNLMVYFAVHDEESLNLHSHYMVIPVNIYTGSSWSAGKKGWYKIGNDLARLMQNYMPSEKISKVQIKFGRTRFL